MLPRPSFRLVLVLALPVLAQQSLHLVVHLSDRLLARNLGTLPLLSQTGIAVFPPQVNLPGVSVLGQVATYHTVWQQFQLANRQQTALQAAQTTAHYLSWSISSYMVLVTVGSTALVARFIGAGERKLANAVTHQSILLGGFLGLAASLAGLLGGIHGLVTLLQLHGDAGQMAEAYLEPMFALLVFQVIEQAGIACLVGAGDTRTGLAVMAGVALLNVPLAWSLCLGLGPFPELGFVGISLGTALSHTLGGLAVLAVLGRGRFGLKLHMDQFRPRTDLLRRLLRVSVPAAFDSLSVVVGQFWFLGIVNSLGTEASSAHGIALVWEGLGYLSGAAFGTAAMALVGQNLGAGRPDQASRSGWLAFTLGCGTMALMGLIFFTLAPAMFRLFSDQQPVIDLGVPVLRLVAFAMPALASTIIFTSALRGAGDTRVPVIFTWVGFFLIRIPLAYLLTRPMVYLGPLGTLPGFDLGLLGAWLAMIADLVMRGLFFFARFSHGAWQKQKV